MLLKLDFSISVPIYQQIRDQIINGIASGELQPGEKMPTVRALSDECGVNVMTIQKAYSLLKQEGYLITDRRSGTAVADLSQRRQVRPATKEGLKLHLSELKTNGFSDEEILELVRSMLKGEK
jgi:GntR family transcriptional regulator